MIGGQIIFRHYSLQSTTLRPSLLVNGPRFANLLALFPMECLGKRTAWAVSWTSWWIMPQLAAAPHCRYQPAGSSKSCNNCKIAKYSCSDKQREKRGRMETKTCGETWIAAEQAELMGAYRWVRIIGRTENSLYNFLYFMFLLL